MEGTDENKGNKKSGFAWVKWVMGALCAVSLAGIIYIAAAKPQEFYGEKTQEKVENAVETAGDTVEQQLAVVPGEPEDTRPFVMLDPGHGGEDQGVNRKRKMEKDINLAVALLVRDELGESCRIMMTREDDRDVSKYDRAILANKEKPDIFVSIHCNSSEVEEAYGIETYADLDDERSIELAEAMQEAVVEAVDGHDRHVRDGSDLVVLYQTDMPSVLVEIGYMTNPEERNRLLDEAYQRKLARGVANCIRDYFLNLPAPAADGGPQTPQAEDGDSEVSGTEDGDSQTPEE